MMRNKITLNNISQSFGTRSVLKCINCQFSQNEIVGIFGPNGSGKTTLFSIIIGLIKPDIGQLLFNEQDITTLPIYLRARLGIGYLPQESSVFRGLSVEDNIKAILELKYSNNAIIEEKATALMQEFAILHLKDSLATMLSGGERRRLEVSRALAGAPNFILLDEPFAGIDPISISDIKRLILHLKERNIGVVITDHNVRDTLDIVDRAYIIYDGNVLIEGTAEQIIRDHRVQEVYLGETFADNPVDVK
jgi:lipopolysaccharide export system ATP-binding protein